MYLHRAVNELNGRWYATLIRNGVVKYIFFSQVYNNFRAYSGYIWDTNINFKQNMQNDYSDPEAV